MVVLMARLAGIATVAATIAGLPPGERQQASDKQKRKDRLQVELFEFAIHRSSCSVRLLDQARGSDR